jgi:hypothetical protein
MSNKEKEELRLLHEIREEQKRDHRFLEEILHFVKPQQAVSATLNLQATSNSKEK